MTSLSRFEKPVVRRTLLKQQKQAAVSGIAASLITFTIILGVLALISFSSPQTPLPPLTIETTTSVPEIEVSKPKARLATNALPSTPPTISNPQVLIGKIPSAISIPPSDLPIEISGFGISEDLGDMGGWGGNLANLVIKERPDISINPALDGTGTGKATFFGQSSQGSRLTFVVETMGGEYGRSSHTLYEFRKVIQRIEGENMLLGVIFFGGPAWGIGDTIEFTHTDFQSIPGDPRKVGWRKIKGAIIHATTDQQFFWNRGNKNRIPQLTEWKKFGEPQNIPWFRMTPTTKSWARKIIAEMESGKILRPLNPVGSHWDHALNMALDMNPPPEQIVFVASRTDPERADQWIEMIGQRAKSMGVKINCLGVLAPDLEPHLSKLARLTGGQCTMVERATIVAAHKNQLHRR